MQTTIGGIENAATILADPLAKVAESVGDALPKMNTWAQGGALIPGFEKDPGGSSSTDSKGDGGTGGVGTVPADFNNPNLTETDIRRRRSVAKLQRGMFDTMRANIGAGKPSLDIPTLASGMLKSKLGI
ncbi:hypothetical protein CCP3SC15_210001 [Gammaproteobacteria bacterium]